MKALEYKELIPLQLTWGNSEVFRRYSSTFSKWNTERSAKGE
jgi:hypothetical protein